MVSSGVCRKDGEKRRPGKTCRPCHREKNGELYLANPEFERTGELPIDIGDSLFAGKMLESFAYAIYPESRGVTSRWLYHAIQKYLQVVRWTN